MNDRRSTNLRRLRLRSRSNSLRLALAAAGLLILLAAGPLLHATSPEKPPGSVSGSVTDSLPDAPQAQAHPASAAPAAKPSLPSAKTCGVRDVGANVAIEASTRALQVAGIEPAAEPGASPAAPVTIPCPIYFPIINWYARFLDGPKVKPLTPKEKAWLAVRNVGDPFNAITILGQSAIAIGADSHSPYGPGMPGFARNVGVSYTEDITAEFFGTFLIPSVMHQDPHYHRMPEASIKRRILHCITQVAWTQGDNGRGMLNYADLVGFAIDDEIANLYVPDRGTNLPASAARYSIGLATAPTDNFITEFLPDLARRIHVRVVLVQRIIDQVAKTNGAGGS